MTASYIYIYNGKLHMKTNPSLGGIQLNIVL